jgi:hypothetical protein
MTPYDPKLYPGDIKPGYYSQVKVKKLLKKHKANVEAIFTFGRNLATKLRLNQTNAL